MATRDYSSKQENIVADYIGGKLTPNSGATGFAKGDILTEDTVVECKTKTKPSASHSIKKEWIEGLKKECISMGYVYYALIFDFGTQDLKDQYAVIPLADFQEYLEFKRKYGTESL
ncbi:MAG: hypothetical protein ACI3T9_04410 [Romboutsia timonensis]